ncbi:unnamed protein product [Pylaiella littoralis]
MIIVNNYDRALKILKEISDKCHNSNITYDNYDSIMKFYKEVGNTFLQLLVSFPNNEDFYTFCVHNRCNKSFLGERGVLSFISHILQDYELFPNILHLNVYKEKESDNKKRLKLIKEKAVFEKVNKSFESRIIRENAVNIRMMTGTEFPRDATFVRITREESNNMDRLNRYHKLGIMFSSTRSIENVIELLNRSSNDYHILVTAVNSKIDSMTNRDDIDKAKTLFHMIIRIRELDNECNIRVDTSGFTPDELRKHSNSIRLHLSFILALNRMLNHLLVTHP